jgi:hypothetical protein
VAVRFELRMGQNVLLVEILINIPNCIRMDKECSSNFVTGGYIEAIFPIMVCCTLHQAREKLAVYMKHFYSTGSDLISYHKP